MSRIMELARRAFTAVLVCTTFLAGPAWPQARALPSGDVQAIYQRLYQKIARIKIFDHHAHPGFGDDPDVDAQATPPQHQPLRARETNPNSRWRRSRCLVIPIPT